MVLNQEEQRLNQVPLQIIRSVKRPRLLHQQPTTQLKLLSEKMVKHFQTLLQRVLLTKLKPLLEEPNPRERRHLIKQERRLEHRPLVAFLVRRQVSIRRGQELQHNSSLLAQLNLRISQELRLILRLQFNLKTQKEILFL